MFSTQHISLSFVSQDQYLHHLPQPHLLGSFPRSGHIERKKKKEKEKWEMVINAYTIIKSTLNLDHTEATAAFKLCINVEEGNKYSCPKSTKINPDHNYQEQCKQQGWNLNKPDTKSLDKTQINNGIEQYQPISPQQMIRSQIKLHILTILNLKAAKLSYI